MGLKQMIEKAMQGDDEAVAALPPVEISGEAHRAYAHMVRQWSGWDNATLVFGDPIVSPFASCHRGTHVFTANPERLLLNPHRVLLTVNPFRLRQEAVLTGALLHESAHARHSHWIPRTDIEADLFTHNDGSAVTKAEFALAKCLEEPRIEGIVATEVDKIGARGLAWTLRASAAHLVPMTELSVDPNQALLDTLGSWALRAGRQLALQFHVSGYNAPTWVGDFTTLLHDAIIEHVTGLGRSTGEAVTTSSHVLEALAEMCRGTDAGQSGRITFYNAADESDTGSFMVDRAKTVLTLLFPETPPNQMPMAGGGCGVGEGESENNVAADLTEGGEGDEAGTGEGNSDPTDEGSGDEPGAGDKGAEGDKEGNSEDTGIPSPVVPVACDTTSAMAKALAQMEAQAKKAATEEGKADASKIDMTGGLDGGTGGNDSIGGGWRMPNPEERVSKTGAEKFLRDLIEPNPSSKVRITDQPSSMIDGAALAAWKAGGQVKAPRFFQQVKRAIKPSPPVKIAILVDVSASMDILQKPSALLSWALAAACLDLRNFAGGGVQIESTLIHWGYSARVIQRNGEILPGIREVGCHEGTTAMDEAIALIETEIPGFLDATDPPENRLLVQFTDWKLNSASEFAAQQALSRVLGAGVNMLSIVPSNYSARYSSLPKLLGNIPVQRGRNTLLRYDRSNPEAVWSSAAQTLDHMKVGAS